MQCNSVQKYERYREKNVEAKRKVEEAKRMSNFKWGQDLDSSYEENKKKFWKEVRRVRKGGLRTGETVKDVNGQLLTPPRPGLISHTCLWGGGFQRYHKSFRIGHKPFYGQVNDKEL